MRPFRRTILQSDFDQLHEGMQRFAQRHWTITANDAGIEPDITLAMLGLEPEKEPWETPRLIKLDEPPTLEEYVAAGYSADNYQRFVANYLADQIEHEHPSLFEPEP